MNFRHAIAFTLLGWYLMTPPLQTVKCSSVPNAGLTAIVTCQARILSEAPLREWKRVPDTQEFEYKTDCERTISNGCHSQVGDDGKSYSEGDLCGADCIAADDPRLKKK
jgi:hypothetical protein